MNKIKNTLKGKSVKILKKTGIGLLLSSFFATTTNAQSETPICIENVVEQGDFSTAKVTISTKKEVDATFNNQMAKEISSEINKARISKGLTVLKYNDGLDNASKIRAVEISEKWSHTRPNGEKFNSVDKYNVYGENLAKGHTDPKKVVNDWLNSPSHRDVLLEKDFKSFSVSVYKVNGQNHISALFSYDAQYNKI